MSKVPSDVADAAYVKVKTGGLKFKDGSSLRTIDKKKKKKKTKVKTEEGAAAAAAAAPKSTNPRQQIEDEKKAAAERKRLNVAGSYGKAASYSQEFMRTMGKNVGSASDRLDARIKKKADHWCK